MVILDSDHRKSHVANELQIYSEIVSVGHYLIVEDTIIGNPILPAFGPGPKEALDEFLKDHPNFQADNDREKFMLTFNPGGYLRRLS